MNTLRYLLFLCFLLFGFASPHNLWAQKKASRSAWMIGGSLGLTTKATCASFCKNNRKFSSSVNSQRIFVHFRWLHWFGITANLIHQREHSISNALIGEPSSNLPPFAQRTVRSDWTSLNIGPHYLLRLGQGDLGLEYELGWSWGGNGLRATSLANKEYRINYQQVNSLSQNIRLSYTYWPKAELGVFITWEYIDISSQTLLDYGPLRPIVPYDRLYPEVPSTILENLAPEPRAGSYSGFEIGITYRLK